MRLYLQDGISVIDGKLKFDPNSSDNIKTSLGKLKWQPYVKTINGFKIISIYNKNNKSPKSDILNALHALKKQKNTNLIDYNKILKRASLFAYKHLKKTPIDLIISIDSSSNLTNDFIWHLMQYIPNKKGISYYDK